MILTFENSELWLRTLAAHDDEDEKSREVLRSAYLNFRSHVAPLANDIALSVPNYTDHGINHCDALWDTASALVGDDFAINPAEAFVLGGSFLVHDLGMGIAAYEGGLEAIYSKVKWTDLLCSLFPESWQALQDAALLDLQANPTWDGISSAKVKSALTVFLREHHAERAETILNSTWRLTNGDQVHLLEETRLRGTYGTVIGKIARSHWIDVSLLPTHLPKTLGAMPGFPSSWTVDPLKVACILRLADAVQIDGRRADPLHTPHRNPQSDSIHHWQFQERLLAPQIVGRRVQFTSSSPFTKEFADAWWLAFDTVKMIDSELRRVDNLCGDLGLPRFEAHSAAGAESPERFSVFVATDAWKPIDARPFIGDPNLIMKSLGGKALYGSGERSSPVPIRELIANALDATRAYRIASHDSPVRAIEITFDDDGDSDYITIRDFGIGMTATDVAGKLCNFGRSGWKDTAMQAAFPGLLSAGYSPTGQFGIGFFSVFMAADEVRVTTRHVDEVRAETSVLEFSAGLDSRPILRVANVDEWLLDSGTSVRLKLRTRINAIGGLFERVPRSVFESGEEFASLIAPIALMADEDIAVRALSSSATYTAITRNMWRECDAGTLFDAMNPIHLRQSNYYATYRADFEKMLRPIHDSKGNLIGRLGLDTLRTGFVDHWLTRGATFVGGLKAGTQSYPTSGVLEGSPDGASRGEANFDLPLEEFRRWFVDQFELVEMLDLEDTTRLELQALAISVDAVRPDFPVAASSKGLVDAVNFKSDIEPLDSFLIVEQRSFTLRINDSEIHAFEDSYSDQMGVLEAGIFAVPDGYGHWSRGMPKRPNDLAIDESIEQQALKVFWGQLNVSPAGELMRLAADAWGVTLLEIIENMRPLYMNTEGDDTRPEVQSLQGTQLRTEALIVVRPAAAGASKA